MLLPSSLYTHLTSKLYLVQCASCTKFKSPAASRMALVDVFEEDML